MSVDGYRIIIGEVLARPAGSRPGTNASSISGLKSFDIKNRANREGGRERGRDRGK
jgi:hypothetical protein